MTEETSQRIWLKWEALMQEASPAMPYPQCVKELTRLLEVVLRALNELGEKEKMLAFFATLDEPSQAEMDMIEGIARFVIPILHGTVRSIAHKSLKTIPKPAGGRPVTCTPKEKVEICREILALIGEAGLNAAEAKRRVARKRQLNPKTVDRIWKDRTQSSAQKMTIDDARQILDKLIREGKVDG